MPFSFTKSISFIDLFSPDHLYNYPYQDSWVKNDEQFYDSDSGMWFGKEVKRLSKKSRASRKSKKLLVQPTLCDKNPSSTSELQKTSDHNDEESVAEAKPRVSPRLFKPVSQGNSTKQGVLPLSISEYSDSCPLQRPLYHQ